MMREGEDVAVEEKNEEQQQEPENKEKEDTVDVRINVKLKYAVPDSSGQGDPRFLLLRVSASQCLSVSASQCLSVSASQRLSVSAFVLSTFGLRCVFQTAH